MAAKRVTHEPAYVLHRYDWSESSLILETFTRHHGRIALVAKGAKRPSSNFRPVLLPLQPLQLTFSGDAEIRTLKSAEWMGGHVMPTGEALLSGYYVNELLLRLLARDDPHEALFDAYAATVVTLSEADDVAAEGALRAFELTLLKEIGLLPDLSVATLTQRPVEDGRRYAVLAEVGVAEPRHGDHDLAGTTLIGLQAALEHGSLAALQQACAAALPELKAILRSQLHYHLGAPSLRTRQVMVEAQNLER